MVEIKNIDTGLCQLYVKMESHNPGGSIKDRTASYIINQAEKDGLLKPGGTIIEATAGNTGIGLALVGILKGYRVLLVIPDKMSLEKVAHLKALGAEVIFTRSDVGKDHPEYYHNVAEKLVNEIQGSFYADQFNNPANILAHEETTGPEIYNQMDGDIDAFVAGVGSGGTITGVGRYLRKVSPQTSIVAADPIGSVIKDAVKTGSYKYDGGSWFVEGIGEDFIPNNCDLEVIDDAISVSDLVIGSVYVVGKEAPKVIKKEMLKSMVDGSVMVDISIDQGGCFETSKPTNHDNPTFLHDGILHYCVTNMPGAVPLTASNALNKATLPFIQEIAEKGITKALGENKHLLNGLNIQNGKIIHPGVKAVSYTHLTLPTKA